MTAFLKDWEKAKKDFKTNATAELKNAGAAFPADLVKQVVEIIKTDTGMTPALKVVDAAFAKKERKTVMQALTKLHAVAEKANVQLQKTLGQAMSKSAEATDNAAVNAFMQLQTHLRDYKNTLTGFENRIAAKLESLQEQKSPTGEKIKVVSLEGDMDGAIARYKSVSKPFADLEKRFKVLDATKPLAKAMQSYSKAVARTQVKAAIAALEDFFEEVDKLDAYGKAIENATPAPDKSFLAAVKNLCEAVRTIKKQRGAESLKQLKQMEAAAN